MSAESYSIFQLIKEDPRYSLEAYQFVREALSYGQNLVIPDEEGEQTASSEETWSAPGEGVPLDGPPEQHITGQMLCEAIRIYALEQFGYMAKIVLNNWGIKTTSDFGEIVYNMIRIGRMKKSRSDRREDFNDVYDFETAFLQQFEITMPE